MTRYPDGERYVSQPVATQEPVLRHNLQPHGPTQSGCRWSRYRNEGGRHHLFSAVNKTTGEEPSSFADLNRGGDTSGVTADLRDNDLAAFVAALELYPQDPDRLDHRASHNHVSIASAED